MSSTIPRTAIVSDWKKNEHRFTIAIPGNTTATVLIPDHKIEKIGSGTHSYKVDPQ
ncbi:MAG TPA: alpha-L-rhamnosidase C-terminal domain-containing protein [Acidobacteriaceae bacterium]